MKRRPFRVSIVVSLLALALAVGAGRSRAQSPSPTPLPLDVPTPRIIREAGILPTTPFALFDWVDEFLERNVFSFWIPTLRARIALAQAAERIAELQALEREGRRTTSLTRRLLRAEERLFSIAEQTAATQALRGTVPEDFVTDLTRTALSAADILDELRERVVVEAELAGPAEPDEPRSELDDLLEELEDEVDDLADVDEEIVGVAPPGQGGVAAVPVEVLRLLAEQKIGKAERDLQRALSKVEERRAAGKVLVADVELRAAAESALGSARQFHAAGNFLESLSAARQARAFVGRLKSGKIAVEPNALLAPNGEEKIQRILEDLTAEGLLGLDVHEDVRTRTHAIVEDVRKANGREGGEEPPKEERRGQGGHSAEDDERDERKDAEEEAGEKADED